MALSYLAATDEVFDLHKPLLNQACQLYLLDLIKTGNIIAI